jgi:hypothetical protein
MSESNRTWLLRGSTKDKLIRFANKAFCCYTINQAQSLLNQLRPELPEPVYQDIVELFHQVQNPDYCPAPKGWGSSASDIYQRSCVRLRQYVEEYIQKEGY